MPRIPRLPLEASYPIPQPLRHSHDEFGDISFELFFAERYHRLPSRLPIYLNVKDKKKNWSKTLDLLDRTAFGLELISKKWHHSRSKSGKAQEDYEYVHVYGSPTRPLMLDLALDGDQLRVDFYFDCRDTDIEEWAQRQLLTVRKEFGEETSPVFRVLKRIKTGFDTEKVNIDRFEVDLAASYNDDFAAVDADIRKAIGEKKSGLVMLYGRPGTGKTSYIKALITEFKDEKFIFIPNDFVNELLKPDFVTFLIRQRNAILVIEDAEKIITSREHVGGNSVVSTLLQLTDGLFSDYLNIKVFCTFNTDRSKIDKALLRKGRMLASYDFQPLSLAKTRALLKAEQPDLREGLTLAEIFNFNARDYGEAKVGAGIGFRR